MPQRLQFPLRHVVGRPAITMGSSRAPLFPGWPASSIFTPRRVPLARRARSQHRRRAGPHPALLPPLVGADQPVHTPAELGYPHSRAFPPRRRQPRTGWGPDCSLAFLRPPGIMCHARRYQPPQLYAWASGLYGQLEAQECPSPSPLVRAHHLAQTASSRRRPAARIIGPPVGRRPDARLPAHPRLRHDAGRCLVVLRPRSPCPPRPPPRRPRRQGPCPTWPCSTTNERDGQPFSPSLWHTEPATRRAPRRRVHHPRPRRRCRPMSSTRPRRDDHHPARRPPIVRSSASPSRLPWPRPLPSSSPGSRCRGASTDSERPRRPLHSRMRRLRIGPTLHLSNNLIGPVRTPEPVALTTSPPVDDRQRKLRNPIGPTRAGIIWRIWSEFEIDAQRKTATSRSP